MLHACCNATSSFAVPDGGAGVSNPFSSRHHSRACLRSNNPQRSGSLAPLARADMCGWKDRWTWGVVRKYSYLKKGISKVSGSHMTTTR